MSITQQDRSGFEKSDAVKSAPTYEVYTFLDENKNPHMFVIPTKFAKKKPQKSKKNLVYRGNIIIPREVGYMGGHPYPGIVCFANEDQFLTNQPLKSDCPTWHVTSNQGYLHDARHTRYIFASEGLTYSNYETRQDSDSAWICLDTRTDEELKAALRTALISKFGNRNDTGNTPARVGRPFVAAHQILILPQYPTYHMGETVERRPKASSKPLDPSLIGPDGTVLDPTTGLVTSVGVGGVGVGDDKDKMKIGGEDDPTKKKRAAATAKRAAQMATNHNINISNVANAAASSIAALSPSDQKDAANHNLTAAINDAAAAATGLGAKRLASAALPAINPAKRQKRDGLPAAPLIGLPGGELGGVKNEGGDPNQVNVNVNVSNPPGPQGPGGPGPLSNLNTVPAPGASGIHLPAIVSPTSTGGLPPQLNQIKPSFPPPQLPTASPNQPNNADMKALLSRYSQIHSNQHAPAPGNQAQNIADAMVAAGHAQHFAVGPNAGGVPNVNVNVGGHPVLHGHGLGGPNVGTYMHQHSMPGLGSYPLPSLHNGTPITSAAGPHLLPPPQGGQRPFVMPPQMAGFPTNLGPMPGVPMNPMKPK